MLGAFGAAEDPVQEPCLRPLRRRDCLTAGTGPGVRPLLYRNATNACMDHHPRRKRRVTTVGSPADLPWLQPYPDRLLDEIAPAPADDEPDRVVVSRETIELAF